MIVSRRASDVRPRAFACATVLGGAVLATPALLFADLGDADWSILFIGGGGSIDLKRTELRRVKPYGERFEVKIGTLKAIDF